MSRARVVVLQVVSKQLSVTAAAAEYGFSRRYLHRLLARYLDGGLDALEPRSRRPKTTPIATPENLRAHVIELRLQLTADGLDAGPLTIAWHLEREGLPALSTSTIRRILHQSALITAQPRKRPRSSYTRFEMAQPNEMWQSDLHPLAAGGRDRRGDPELAGRSLPLPAVLHSSTPANSSPPIRSARTRPTGATKTKSPAAGRDPRNETHDATHLRHMSRLITKWS